MLGSSVFHSMVPAQLKAPIDRIAHSSICSLALKKKKFPRLCKVGGVIAVGGSRFGGQEFTMQFLINHLLIMNSIVVSGDIDLMSGSYIGVGG